MRKNKIDLIMKTSKIVDIFPMKRFIIKIPQLTDIEMVMIEIEMTKQVCLMVETEIIRSQIATPVIEIVTPTPILMVLVKVIEMMGYKTLNLPT